jgi:8-oxo-dGTP diphosphatase
LTACCSKAVQRYPQSGKGTDGIVHRVLAYAEEQVTRQRRRTKEQLHQVLLLAQLTAIRYAPLPKSAKARLIWLGGPKVLLASCAIIRDESGRILVLRSRYSNEWQLPGGCVNRNESALDAVKRECREELGLAISNPRLLGLHVDMYGLAQTALFSCVLVPGAVRLSVEHTAYAYLDGKSLPANLRCMVETDARPED